MRRYLGFLCLVATTVTLGAYGRPMDISRSRYVIAPGEPASLEAGADTIDFLLRAKTRKLSIDGFTVAPNHTGDQILIAHSPRVKPGTYTVTLSATSASGEQRETALDIVVKPMVTVPPTATRAPVVLLNGWELGFTGSCPVSTSSTQSFGNLAQYLIADGVPVVYLFDNCAVDPNQPVEVLAADLASFLNSIKYDDGTQVQQIDLVGFSLGGLVARAYLAGLQTSQAFIPPSPTLVHKLILLATPNAGSYLAGNYIGQLAAGTQDAELEPASALLWNLATWNQHGDDLRGIDTIAVAGNAGTYTAYLSTTTAFTNAGDGLVSLTSASMGFVANPVETNGTRVVPYCHVDPSAFLNTAFGSYLCNAVGIANVTDTNHLTGQIVRSFLAGTSAWSSIGTAPSGDQYLNTNGGMMFGLQSAAGAYASDMTSVTFGTLALSNGGATGTIYFGDLISGTGQLTAVSKSIGTVNCGSLKLPTGYVSAARCKVSTDVFTVTPLVGSTGRTLAPGATVTINGTGFGASQCNGCVVQATPAGSSTAQNLTVSSWSNTAIAVKLPANLTGLLTLYVKASAGADNIGVFVATGSTIAVAPASLTFSYGIGGTALASQQIQISNSGTGTLAWTATASDSWLSISPASGTAPSTLSVSINPANLTAGTYNGTVTIAASGATSVTVNVALTVSAAPSASFQYTIGGTVPAAQTISITAANATSWTASADSYWITLSPSSGTTPGTLSIGLNPANLAAGTYTGNVTVTGGVTPATIPVTLVVQGTQPTPSVSAAVNAATYQPFLAPATWISIFGTGLSQSTYSWQASDFVNGNLPTSLQGVSVTINGKPAYVGYISPTQINVLAPDDSTVGLVQVQVTTAKQASNTITAQENQFSPALLTFANNYVAALHGDYTPITTASPAKPGETVQIYGIGFGPTNPATPTGQLVNTGVPLANSVTFTVGGQPAIVSYAGLVQAGTYQFNVTVPTLGNGDAAIAASIPGNATQSGVNLSVHQ